jgi:GTPase SAR1 family protein
MRIGDGKMRVETEPTVGVDMRNKTFLYGDENLRVKLQIWDTAG